MLLLHLLLTVTSIDLEQTAEMLPLHPVCLPCMSGPDIWCSLPMHLSEFAAGRPSETGCQSVSLLRPMYRAAAVMTGAHKQRGGLLCQACCHPQIVRRDDNLMGGTEHLGMHDIMGRLVAKAFQEYDVAVQKWVRAQMMLASVLWHIESEGGHCSRGSHPCFCARRL